MSRYSSINIIQPKDEPRRYLITKYPEIPFGNQDYYMYTTQGDRYDILAQTYYLNSQLWWIISIANPSLPQDSLIPPLGVQLRVPHPNRVTSIVASFEGLNLR
jgi:hypothetical protein